MDNSFIYTIRTQTNLNVISIIPFFFLSKSEFGYLITSITIVYVSVILKVLTIHIINCCSIYKIVVLFYLTKLYVVT